MQERTGTSGRYLEDFAVGQTFASGRLTVEAAEIKAFAAAFDPQPFHLDEEAAAAGVARDVTFYRSPLTRKGSARRRRS